jgi:hypothetical protein
MFDVEVIKICNTTGEAVKKIMKLDEWIQFAKTKKEKGYTYHIK